MSRHMAGVFTPRAPWGEYTSRIVLLGWHLRAVPVRDGPTKVLKMLLKVFKMCLNVFKMCLRHINVFKGNIDGRKDMFFIKFSCFLMFPLWLKEFSIFDCRIEIYVKFPP